MRMGINLGIAALVLLTAGAHLAHADDIVIHNTGVDDNGIVLPRGESDPHYTLISAPTQDTEQAAFKQRPVHTWVQSDAEGGAGSAWIGSTPDGFSQVRNGEYVYRTTFDLDGLDPLTAGLTASLAVDNQVQDILLNGESLGIVVGNFTQLSPPFDIAGTFAEGVNTLDFVVRNIGMGPSGLRVEIAGTADPLAPQLIEVNLDVVPNRRGLVSLRSRRNLRAVVFGTADFDVQGVDVASLRLGGAAVDTDRDGERDIEYADVDGDGTDDLVFSVEPREMTVDCETSELVVSGFTVDGVELTGSDDITTTCSVVRAWLERVRERHSFFRDILSRWGGHRGFSCRSFGN